MLVDRMLQPGDEVALDSFLARYPDTSMFLRSNARAGGLSDRGEPMQGTYVAATEEGAIIAVAAHCWNGMVLVQAPVHLETVVRAAVAQSHRDVTGLAGPWDQVVAARRALGLEARRTRKDSREDLFALDLRNLAVPPLLAEDAIHCRHLLPDELDLIVEWRVAFALEVMGEVDSPELRASCREGVLLHHRRGSDWLLLYRNEPLSYAIFNAMLPDVVQIGGVWTPPKLRGRGYGRSVVAGSLLAARKQGVQRSILFADPDNPPAERAYLALGFRRTGDYGLVLFEP